MLFTQVLEAFESGPYATRVEVVHVHRKGRRWSKWMEAGGMWSSFHQRAMSKNHIVRTYQLGWFAN